MAGFRKDKMRELEAAKGAGGDDEVREELEERQFLGETLTREDVEAICEAHAADPAEYEEFIDE